MRLHFEECGAGESLILLHGLFGSSQNWQTIARKLSTDFQVICLDLRNHGKSPHSREMSYEVMAGDVNEFMASRGVTSASFLGHSMGGKVAMEFALTFPGMVSRLVVADIAPKAYDPRHDSILDALTGLDLSRFSDRLQIEAALAPAIPELAVRRFLLKSLKRSGQHFEWQIGLGEIADSYPQISEELTGGRQFRGPTLFLRGAASDYVLDSDLPRIRELFPETDIKTLAGAGHWLHAEAPEAFVSAVRKFLLTPTARV